MLYIDQLIIDIKHDEANPLIEEVTRHQMTYLGLIS